jgi:hypothetical protein
LARRLFALSTCNGCHAGETLTTFTHGAPRMREKAAEPSLFLKGKDSAGKPFRMIDPVKNRPDPPNTAMVFSDLERRANDLQDLVEYGMSYELYRLPLHTVH